MKHILLLALFPLALHGQSNDFPKLPTNKPIVMTSTLSNAIAQAKSNRLANPPTPKTNYLEWGYNQDPQFITIMASTDMIYWVDITNLPLGMPGHYPTNFPMPITNIYQFRYFRVVLESRKKQ